MSSPKQAAGPSQPRPVPSSSSPSSQDQAYSAGTTPRAAATAKLATSPVATPSARATTPIPQVPVPSHIRSGSHTPLGGTDDAQTTSGPGVSALAQAFQGSLGMTPPRYGTPPTRPLSPAPAGSTLLGSTPQTTYGSFETGRSGNNGGKRPSGISQDEARIVKRHLVQPLQTTNDLGESSQGRQLSSTSHSSIQGTSGQDERGSGLGDDDFSSLQLQGGDVTREVYRSTEDAESPTQGMKGKRSKSFHVVRPQPESETEDASAIKQPGGFRRDYLRRNAPNPTLAQNGSSSQPAAIQEGIAQPKKSFLARNFMEFLSIYGHFAGERLAEDDQNDLFPSQRPQRDHRADEDGDGHADGTADGGEDNDSDSDHDPLESSALLTSGSANRRQEEPKEPIPPGRNSPVGAAGLLLKSFIGTGVLFLPKAYLNGGMYFSNIVLLSVAALSFLCFILLVNTRLKIEGSFGDIGGILYGKWLRTLILASVTLSQIGFVSAYIVFTAENVQAFILAVSKCRLDWDLKYLVFAQLIVLLPFSLTRNLEALGFIAVLADVFIFLGLIALYYYDIRTLVENHGPADYVGFNSKDWSLFIGTAIFTFEGVGLIIPIQEAMREPKKFGPVLGGVMVFITIVFVSMGALSYATFGSATRTVLFSNLPQDEKLVNAVQIVYSIAILLSTPLQFFPAIKIMETELFHSSGKNNPWVKWEKNALRFALVISCAMIAWGGAGDLDKFVALVGSFACVPLVYIYPPMLHYRGVADARWKRIGDVLLCIFGFCMMVYTTGMTIMNWVTSSTPPYKPGYCE